ncbi:MAG: hypothetical protein FJW69_10685, partial [Actinobacteria bacterium]|nr:hypothetical protein [Actinomycetota bacterium]
MNVELLTMIVFFSIIGFFLWRDRKNFEFHTVIFIRRWKRGLEFIDIIIKKHSKLIKFSGYVAIVVGILAGLIGLGILTYSAYKGVPGARLILPTAGGYEYPGPVIPVPFWYWLIAIFIILFVHETMHAIYARAAKVPLKNYGIMLLVLLPIGAFVEPDMKRVQRLKLSKKLSFIAAGSFGNFITGLLFLLLGAILV